MFCAYAMPFLFPKKGTLLISATSCLFDASCILFPAMNSLYSLGISFNSLIAVHAGLAVVVFSLLVLAWWLCREELRESRLRGANVSSPDVSEAEQPLAARPLAQQLWSFEFVCILLYSAVQVSWGEERRERGRAREAEEL